MSFKDKLENHQRKDAVDRLEEYLRSLPEGEYEAFVEIVKTISITAAFEALKEEEYVVGRETVTGWVKRYVV